MLMIGLLPSVGVCRLSLNLIESVIRLDVMSGQVIPRTYQFERFYLIIGWIDRERYAVLCGFCIAVAMQFCVIAIVIRGKSFALFTY